MFIQIWPNFGLKKRSFFGKIGFDLFVEKTLKLVLQNILLREKTFFYRIFSHFIQNCFPVVVIGMHLWHKSELLLNILSFLSIFLKNGPTQASFCLYSFFSAKILQKNCRLQRDSNSLRPSRRYACCTLDPSHHHWPFVNLTT